MKLRNKKTGEIVETDYIFGVSVPTAETFGCKSYNQIAAYSSLAELNDEWEDVEEPKEYWYIDYGGRIKFMTDANDEEDVARKQIGNYFETREEAEKAVEKLKAWKRLKDIGFKFVGAKGEYIKWDIPKKEVTFSKAEGYWDDFYLLFGGKE